MKNTILLLLTAFCLQTAFAQQDSDRKITNDPKSQAILDKVSKNYRDMKSLESTFTLRMFSKADGIDEKYNGTVILKGQKYKIDTDHMEVICDNVKRYIWMKGVNEVTINLYEPDGETIESPAQLFTIYEKNFFY